MRTKSTQKIAVSVLSACLIASMSVPAFAAPGEQATWSSLATKIIAMAQEGNNGDNDVDVSELLKVDISGASVTFGANPTYTGSPVQPAPTVTLNGKTLVAGTDYTIAYANNVNAGRATVTITGIGQYKGTVSSSFTIATASIASAQVTVASNQTYTGSAIKPKPTVKLGNKTLVEGTDYTTSYKNNVNVGTATVTVTGKGNYAATKNATFTIVAASKPSNPNQPTNPSNPAQPDDPGTQVESVTMYRLYNPNSGEHFYTTSTIERDAVIAAGWNDEGIGWIAPSTGAPVYRLYNQYGGEHHYTMSEVERDMLVSVGWIWEEGGWFSDPNQAVPLYRLYNPNAYANNHHYTTSEVERDYLLSIGWNDEDIAWHGIGIG